MGKFLDLDIGLPQLWSKITGKISSHNEDETAHKNIRDSVSSVSSNVNTLTTAVSSLTTTVNNKVDKDGTKVLSTNDYTTAEKTKLSGIEVGANKTTIDSKMSDTSTNPVQNKIIFSALAEKANTEITDGLESRTATLETKIITPATTSTIGMMSAADKAKLEGIEARANKITVDSDSINSSSTNPVQNKLIYAALASKANTADVKTVSDNLASLGGRVRQMALLR